MKFTRNFVIVWYATETSIVVPAYIWTAHLAFLGLSIYGAMMYIANVFVISKEGE